MSNAHRQSLYKSLEELAANPNDKAALYGALPNNKKLLEINELLFNSDAKDWKIYDQREEVQAYLALLPKESWEAIKSGPGWQKYYAQRKPGAFISYCGEALNNLSDKIRPNKPKGSIGPDNTFEKPSRFARLKYFVGTLLADSLADRDFKEFEEKNSTASLSPYIQDRHALDKINHQRKATYLRLGSLSAAALGVLSIGLSAALSAGSAAATAAGVTVGGMGLINSAVQKLIEKSRQETIKTNLVRQVLFTKAMMKEKERYGQRTRVKAPENVQAQDPAELRDYLNKTNDEVAEFAQATRMKTYTPAAGIHSEHPVSSNHPFGYPAPIYFEPALPAFPAFPAQSTPASSDIATVFANPANPNHVPQPVSPVRPIVGSPNYVTGVLRPKVMQPAVYEQFPQRPPTPSTPSTPSTPQLSLQPQLPALPPRTMKKDSINLQSALTHPLNSAMHWRIQQLPRYAYISPYRG